MVVESRDAITLPAAGQLSQCHSATMTTSMITAAQWVPRGFAAPFPQKYEFDEEEFARIADLAKLQLDDAEEDLKEAQEAENGEGSKKKDNESGMEVDGKKGSEKIKYVLVRLARLSRC